jgi:RNA polymerase sigma-70 factor (ECF subfamily)
MQSFGNNLPFTKYRDPEQFGFLFRQYSKSLFYYAAKFVDDDTARDIVQDVFFKLWSDQSIIVKQSLQSLLFTMTRNNCLQYLEKQKVRNRHAGNSKLKLREYELVYYMDEQTSLIQIELETRVNEVITRLPDRCRQIFVMSRLDNKRNKEIAEELNISVKAVEKQISKALSTIRTELKDYLPLILFLYSQVFRD